MDETRKIASNHHTAAFEPFLVVEENEFAYSACTALKNAPASHSSQVAYIYGPSGVGKTHLCRQFVRDMKRERPDAQIVAVSASDLAVELSQAIRGRHADTVREHYQRFNVFVCEDVHTLGGRRSAQNLLSSIMDVLVPRGDVVLVTGNAAPGELENVSRRLVNRLHAGICAGIHMPDGAGRIKFLIHFSRRMGLPMPSDVLQTLAEAMPVSPRELQASIVQLEVLAREQGMTSVNAALVKQFLASGVPQSEPTLPDIARVVSRHFGVSLKQIRSGARLQQSLLPRQCAMYLARELTNVPLQQIGRYFGRPNHSTVAHACSRIRAVLEEEPALRQHLSQLRQTLSSRSPSGAAR